jgi:hypothetical protein
VLRANFFLKIKNCFPFAYFHKNTNVHISSCNPQIVSFDEYTTLQLEIVKKWLNFNLNYCII